MASDEENQERQPAGQEHGDADQARGRIENALQSYRHALEHSSGEANGADKRASLGDAHVYADQSLSALREYRRAIRKSPRRAQPHFALAELYRRYGKMQAALVEYRTAIECDPKNAFYHYKLGDALADGGFVLEAISELEAAVELSPSDAFYHFWISDLYLTAARLDDAVREMQQATMFAPYDDYYNMRLGILYMLGQHTTDAAAAMHQAIRVAPGNAIYRSLLGDIFSTDADEEHERIANEHYEAAGVLDDYDVAHLKRLRSLIRLRRVDRSPDSTPPRE